MRANGARGGVAPLTATDVEYCCCFDSAADERRARDRVATLATAELMVMIVCTLYNMQKELGDGRSAIQGLPSTPKLIIGVCREYSNTLSRVT